MTISADDLKEIMMAVLGITKAIKEVGKESSSLIITHKQSGKKIFNFTENNLAKLRKEYKLFINN